MEMIMNRRKFVRTMCLGGIATFGFPVVNFAQTRRGGRFVFVLLRGGFDGLAAVVPYGDPSYRSLRGAFAFDESELVALTDTFGLAPGLAPLRELWQKDELAARSPLTRPGWWRSPTRSGWLLASRRCASCGRRTNSSRCMRWRSPIEHGA